MKINNRRYIGCKTKLLSFIDETVERYKSADYTIFADIFSGTGVVADFYAEKGYKVIMNDNLKSNTIVYEAFLGEGSLNVDKIRSYLKRYNSINSKDLETNYFSEIYGNKYFSENDAKRIGFIRDDIEVNKESLSKKEYAYLITSLLYACDKISNTVGHYESFLKVVPADKGVVLEELNISNYKKPADIYCEDANDLVKHITADIAYIDPPYNARQYVNFYHVLENLVRWEKPSEFEGNSMKFKRNNLKSGYCRSSAPTLFERLISDLKCKLIIVSYSNTYVAKSSSSINLISPDQMVRILKKRGKVSICEMNYKAFNSGKTDMSDHKEFLYVCEVDK